MILTILEKDTIRWQTEVKCHIIRQIIESQIKRAKRLSQRLRLILDTELRSHNISFFQLGQIAIHYLIADFVHVIFWGLIFRPLSIISRVKEHVQIPLFLPFLVLSRTVAWLTVAAWVRI